LTSAKQLKISREKGEGKDTTLGTTQ